MMTHKSADRTARAVSALDRRSARTGAACTVLLLLSGPATLFAQAGVPGSRLESAADHRSAVRAEAYKSVAKFFAEWREAWNGGDAVALSRLYTDDAVLRLPGQNIVRSEGSIEVVARAAVQGGGRLSMVDVDFDGDGQRSILVARYVQYREGHAVAGVMTAIIYGHRLRVHIFDAPEIAATGPGVQD